MSEQPSDKSSGTPSRTDSHSTTSRWLILRSETAAKREAAGGLTSAEFGVFVASPVSQDEIRGGIVLIQEIFGVNPHIRELATRYAAEGYLTYAPAFFDHIEKGVELEYDTGDFTRGRELVSKLGWDQAVEDVRITADALRKNLSTGHKIAAIGFCWGGAVAWLASSKAAEAIDAAVGYYGRAIWEFRTEKPKRPTLLHYGAHDASIPLAQVEDVKALHPGVPVHVYDAGHGFNCSARKDFNPEAARLAAAHTRQFLDKYILSN